MIRVLLCIFCVLVVLPFSAQAADGLLKQSVTVNGVERNYLIHLPAGFKPKAGPYPVVMAYHGGGGTAEGMADMTRLNDTADKYGFIAVYPEGTAPEGKNRFRTWNAGTCCGTAMEKKVDDVAYSSAIMDEVRDQFRADPKRIYLTGHSNGAMMVYRLACALSERVAAVAPNAGQNVFHACPDARPMPVMHIHGTADKCALYGGGTCGGCFSDFLGGGDEDGESWDCLDVRESMWRRARDYGCTRKTEITDKRRNMTCERWAGCTVYEGEVTLCTVAGGGHNWPGGATGLKLCESRPNGVLCRKWMRATGPYNDDIPLNDMMWTFFKRWERP